MPTPKKTIRQHLLHGTVPQGKPEKGSSYQGGRAKIPAHIVGVARAEFKRVHKILEDRGTGTPGDFATIAIYSEVFARWIQAKAAIGEDLMVTTQVTDNNGTLRTVTRVNPLLKIVSQCEAQLLRLTASMGLTPATREKVVPTALNQDQEIVPGSIADLYPQLLKGNKQ